ncbi:MAG: hypothetical protein JRE45_20380 [Deltaproteobacteria bacterium]|nr:hypothetical protein [Deltaproteobacteria bacterium]
MGSTCCGSRYTFERQEHLDAYYAKPSPTRSAPLRKRKPLTDDEIAGEIIKAHSRFHGSGAKIRVENGAVFISATFRHPRDDLFLKQRVAEIEGVIAIEIDPMFVAQIGL